VKVKRILIFIIIYFGLNLIKIQAQQVINFESRKYDTRDTGWHGNLELIFNLVQNQNQILTLGNKFQLEHKRDVNTYLFLNEFNFVRANTQNLEYNSYQHLRYKKQLKDWLSGEAYAQTQFNQQIGLKFRGLLGAGPRFRLYDNDSIKVFISPKWLYTYEETTDELARNVRNRFSLYASFIYYKERNFNFDLVLYYQPDVIDFSDFLVLSEIKAEWLITQKLAFRFSLGQNYNSKPPPGIPNNAINARNSFLYRF
jgi:hypothetical protein